MKKIICLALLTFLCLTVRGQSGEGALSNQEWKANWITVPKSEPGLYAVYYFRKSVILPTVPRDYIVHVSADNRYKLFVNGKLVSQGPARGDPSHWNYDTIDLTTELVKGNNTISALVWNEGSYRMEAQMSVSPAFILQFGNNAKNEINTDTSWRCIRDTAYKPIKGIGYSVYYVAGPGEFVDEHFIVRNWRTTEISDQWSKAVIISHGHPKGYPNVSGWMLVPSTLPQMETHRERLVTLRKATGIIVPDGFPGNKIPVIIPAHSNASLLLDQSHLTNAYVNMKLNGGDKAGISLTYAESPLRHGESAKKIFKPNRNDINDSFFWGRKDSVISNGDPGQTFTSLSFRTYRYILIHIETQDQPLELTDIYGDYTGYPFKLASRLNTNNPEISKILEIGWRTARLCAEETYMDCPYYERLQYIGDSKIQALISYYNSGDERLARNALNQMDNSRIAEGLTLSRYPSGSLQLIPTFSLLYVSMVHDYLMYRNDPAFVKNKLQGIRNILDFFSHYQDENGSLKHLPYWNFVDWANGKGWSSGVPPMDREGGSSNA